MKNVSFLNSYSIDVMLNLSDMEIREYSLFMTRGWRNSYQNVVSAHPYIHFTIQSDLANPNVDSPD